MIVVTSCNPRITTQILKSYPAIVSPDSVVVYNIGDTVPGSATTIGHVNVRDGGFTTKCKYDEVLSFAKNEVSKNGGNGLMITAHSKPSVWSSCHQISGTMLLLDSKIINDSLLVNKHLNQFVPSKIMVNKRIVPRNTFSASVGYAYIYSDIYNDGDGFSSAVASQLRSGTDWRFEYEHSFKSGWGVGIIYSGFRSSVSFYGGSDSFNSTYIAPFVSGRWMVGDKWMLAGKYGIGYFRHDEKASNGYNMWASGVGISVDFGAEYMLTKHLGIGLSIGAVTSQLGDMKDNLGNVYSSTEDNANGIARITILPGFRFYF
ncbi:hypothetical protein [Bacteroides sedimenti]|uniref:Outer membrane protein beta-barrel domain-containing protein n=1 Tax=Bacteroides sedimenti TaxID=2136147 RepID=A0ABM8ICP8_9BACE